MFMLGDINLNSVDSCTASCKEMLRQKMLNQEVVFQAQLYELHRLYREQMNLMEEYKQIESNSFYLKNRKTSSAPFTLADQATYRSHFGQAHFTACRGAISMLPINAGISSKQHQTDYNPCLGIPERKGWPLDLQPPTVEFISLINDDLHRSQSRRNRFVSSCRFKTLVDPEKVSDFKDTKLSLGIRDGIMEKAEHGKKKCQFIPHDAIDVEDPNFGLPSEKQRYTWFSGVGPSSFTPGAKRHLGHEVIDGRCVSDIGPSYFRQMPFSSGFRGQQTELSTTDVSNKQGLREIQRTDVCDERLTCLSRNTIDLDLNLPQVDTSLSLSYNSAVLNSVSVLSAVSQPVNAMVPLHDATVSCSMKSNDGYFHENSGSEHQKKAAGFCLVDGYNEIQGNESKSSKLEIIDLESPSGSTLDVCEGLSAHPAEHKNESAGSVLEHSDGRSFVGVQRDVDAAKLNLNKAAEDVVSMYPCQGPMESDGNTDSRSGVVDWGDSRSEPGKVCLGSNVKESAPGEADQRSPEAKESKNIECADGKEEVEGVEELVRAAAEAIVCISSQMRAEHHRACLRWRQPRENDNGPEHSSSDSYELLVLRERESDPEDYEVSSDLAAPSEVLEKGGSPYKLKRGTRMRDFQKDVLPALSCLSRHEIFEDVSILEKAVRSRDYKKRMRSKMGEEKGTWCTSNRSRRSRTNYRRKYYA